MATDDSAAVLANRWNGNSQLRRQVRNWDNATNDPWRHDLDDHRVAVLTEHEVVGLDNDTVGMHDFGLGGAQDQGVGFGGIHAVKEEEDRDTNDDDDVNAADSEK